MSADGYSIYLICDNGSIYTSDPYDLSGQDNKQPYINLSDISGINPNRSQISIFNGKMYYSNDQKITATATFNNALEMAATLNNLKEHLLLIAMATTPAKDRIYVKKAILAGLDYSSANYINGAQSKLTIATTGNWISGDFSHTGNGLWSNHPKLDFRSDNTTDQGFLLQVTGDKMTIGNTTLDLQQVPLDLDSDEKIFISETGMIYRENHQDLVNIGDVLINTNANTYKLAKILYSKGFEMGGINAGFLMPLRVQPADKSTKASRIEDDYQNMLDYIHNYTGPQDPVINGAKFIALAKIGRRDFI